MAAGGFKEFQAGEVLDQDDINDYLLQGVLVFAGTAARGSAITSPVEGQFSFLQDSDSVEFFDGSGWVELSSGGIAVEYLVVAGGGGGGKANSDGGGGGGAGGYRNNVVGELSGGSVTAEPELSLAPASYRVVVGAGGAGGNDSPFRFGYPGNTSVFGFIYSQGGGGGGCGFTTPQTVGQPGGSGGGGGSGESGSPVSAGAGFSGIGTNGGAGRAGGLTTDRCGGGGGGAGSAGVASSSGQGGNGGDGLSSSITGSAVTRGGGGAGAARSGTNGTAGSGGGGAVNSAGTANTGGGGGGGTSVANGGAGGSGIVIFRVPIGTSVSFSGGVTSSNANTGTWTYYSVTAAGPTDTVTIG